MGRTRRWQIIGLLVVAGTLEASPASAARASGVATGSSHSCALTSAGELWCWGLNTFGQLGDGTTTSRSTPVVVSGFDGAVVAVAAGWGHTCALTSSSALWCWGLNVYGQLGDGTTTDRHVPLMISAPGSGVAGVAAGMYHTCAVSTAGAAACWGLNLNGQLGDGTTTTRLAPVWVSGLGSGVVVLAAGYAHTCALTTGGAVQCWGRNGEGQLGDGTTMDRLTPVAVSGLGSGATAIASGGWHTCAVSTAGAAACWGYNLNGQLGNGTTMNSPIPVEVIGLGSGAVAVIGGHSHSCSAMNTGVIRCWGLNSAGQLGDGTTTRSTTPVAVGWLPSGIVALAAGWHHVCAVPTAGGVSCWGENSSGQLGDGTTADRWTPVHVVGFEGRLSQRGDFTGDLKSDILWWHATRGEVWLWPMEGPVRTTEIRVGTVADTVWEIRGLGDQTANRAADILWRNKTTGQVYSWPMNGGTRLAEVYVATVDPAYDIVGTGDYNGDGMSDILWRQLANGEVWVWLMNGATTVSATYVTAVDPGYAVVGSGDLNGDLKADIVWRGAGGDVWVWLMDGATPTAMTYVTTVEDLGYRIVGVADHTGDGKADILWWHNTRGEVWLWPMNGSTRVTETLVATVPDTGYRIVASGDYDGDGKADLLWHHATRGEVWLWPMNGATRLAETKVATVPDTGYQIVK